MTTTRTHFREPRGVLALWGGVLLPPLAFMLNLQIAYTLVTLACESARPWLHLSTAAMLLLALGGGALAWRSWKRAGEEPSSREEGTLPRSRFLAIVGLMSAALFTLTILVQWLPMFVLRPCGQI